MPYKLNLQNGNVWNVQGLVWHSGHDVTQPQIQAESLERVTWHPKLYRCHRSSIWGTRTINNANKRHVKSKPKCTWLIRITTNYPFICVHTATCCTPSVLESCSFFSHTVPVQAPLCYDFQKMRQLHPSTSHPHPRVWKPQSPMHYYPNLIGVQPTQISYPKIILWVEPSPGRYDKWFNKGMQGGWCCKRRFLFSVQKFG